MERKEKILLIVLFVVTWLLIVITSSYWKDRKNRKELENKIDNERKELDETIKQVVEQIRQGNTQKDSTENTTTKQAKKEKETEEENPLLSVSQPVTEPVAEPDNKENPVFENGESVAIKQSASIYNAPDETSILDSEPTFVQNEELTFVESKTTCCETWAKIRSKYGVRVSVFQYYEFWVKQEDVLKIY